MTRTASAALIMGVILAACRGGERPRPTAENTYGSGPDPIVIRVARNGGLVRAYRYPRLDSLVWRSTDPAPALGTIIGFDQEDGILAYLARNGLPGWIDLRVGSVRPATRVQLAGVATADAWAVYGIRRDTAIQRLTPSGDWSLALKERILRLFPLPDGSLLVLRSRDQGNQLVRIRPPEATLLDSAEVELPRVATVSPLGDRVYMAARQGVTPLGAQTLRNYGRVALPFEAAAMTPTPSGDRLFVALEGRPEIAVINRFSNAREATISLPGPASDLRMDPLGRMLLARAATGDSAWVIGVATNRVTQTLATKWREDLPTITADGAVVSIQNADVLFTVPGEARPRIRVQDGANEVWHFVFWNGFRPRAKELDLPVVFEDSLPPPTVQPAAQPDSTIIARPSRLDSAPPRIPAPAPVDTPTRPTPARDAWTVSFAAVLSEDRARDLARQISVDGQNARVVVTQTEGVRIHRVILGPYNSRSEAERVGKASGRSYWVFEGPP